MWLTIGSMMAAVLHGKEDLRIEDVPEPSLRPGEVRLAIHAALTCGTDLKVYRRGYHAKMIVPPARFGHELAGTISEIGPGIASWHVGDRVVAANSAPCGVCPFCQRAQENLCTDLLFLNGGYAQSIVLPERLVQKNLLRLEPGTTFPDAALTEPLACVVQGVSDLNPQPGDRVLVLGAGPIGLMFVALCRDLGCIVTVSGRGTHRLETALALGATDAIDSNKPPEEIKKLSRNGFDLVIEAVGKPETWQLAVQLVRKGGRVNFFGGCSAGTSVELDTGLIHYSNLTLLASFHHRPATIRHALALIERGVITSRHFVDGEHPLSSLPTLFKSMCEGNKAVKTLVRVDR